MGITLKEYQDYLVENKSLVLATVTENETPNLRHIGAYNVDGTDIVFQTKKNTAKTTEINNNENVAAVFQHEGQSGLKNITVYGKAELLELDKAAEAVELIKERRPQLQYNPEINIVYRIKVDQIKSLDFSTEEKTQLIDVRDLA